MSTELAFLSFQWRLIDDTPTPYLPPQVFPQVTRPHSSPTQKKKHEYLLIPVSLEGLNNIWGDIFVQYIFGI